LAVDVPQKPAMINRRDFLLSSSLAVLGISGIRSLAQSRARPLGVQLYTVRTQAEQDLPGVLASLRQIGYREVETYWNVYTHPAAELKRMIEDHGLVVPSGHFDYEGLEGKLDYASRLGVRYLICPMLPKSMWNSLDGFKQAADQFNRWGEQVERRGMRFGFHNHNYEFRRFGETTGFEVLVSRTEPTLVSFEMDCYWITQAGQDPLQMLEKLGPRIRLLHLKDRKPGFPPSQELNDQAEHFTPVGTGTIRWKEILAAARSDGIEHMFVEQDSGDLPPLEELRISYKNLEPLL
jgi:sugar phosphate isomerase/epimerase